MKYVKVISCIRRPGDYDDIIGKVGIVIDERFMNIPVKIKTRKNSKSKHGYFYFYKCELEEISFEEYDKYNEVPKSGYLIECNHIKGINTKKNYKFFSTKPVAVGDLVYADQINNELKVVQVIPYYEDQLNELSLEEGREIKYIQGIYQKQIIEKHVLKKFK